MTFYQYFQQQILMKKNLLLFFVCQTLSLGFLFGQIPAQNKSLKNFGTFTMRISGKMQIIQVDEEENLYLLIHKKDTLIFFNNAKVYSQAEIYLFPGREEIDKTTKIDKSSWRYNELKDVRKIRIRKRRNRSYWLGIQMSGNQRFSIVCATENKKPEIMQGSPSPAFPELIRIKMKR